MAKGYEWERKRLVGVHIAEYDYCFFEKKVEQLAIDLHHILKDLEKKDIDNAEFVFSWYYDDVTIYLKGDRMETDEEFNTRIANQKRWIELDKNKKQKKQKTQEDEYKHYLRLKKKYEKES